MGFRAAALSALQPALRRAAFWVTNMETMSEGVLASQLQSAMA
jgi:hypothetical protein